MRRLWITFFCLLALPRFASAQDPGCGIKPLPPCQSCPRPCQTCPPPVKERHIWVKVPCPEQQPTGVEESAQRPPAAPQGVFVAPPRSGVTEEGNRSYGLRGFALHFPAMSLRLPTLELPTLARYRSNARMRLDEATAPFVPQAAGYTTGYGTGMAGMAARGAGESGQRPSDDGEESGQRDGQDEELAKLKQRVAEMKALLQQQQQIIEQLHQRQPARPCPPPEQIPCPRPYPQTGDVRCQGDQCQLAQTGPVNLTPIPKVNPLAPASHVAPPTRQTPPERTVSSGGLVWRARRPAQDTRWR